MGGVVFNHRCRWKSIWHDSGRNVHARGHVLKFYALYVYSSSPISSLLWLSSRSYRGRQPNKTHFIYRTVCFLTQPISWWCYSQRVASFTNCPDKSETLCPVFRTVLTKLQLCSYLYLFIPCWKGMYDNTSTLNSLPKERYLRNMDLTSKLSTLKPDCWWTQSLGEAHSWVTFKSRQLSSPKRFQAVLLLPPQSQRQR